MIDLEWQLFGVAERNRRAVITSTTPPTIIAKTLRSWSAVAATVVPRGGVS